MNFTFEVPSELGNNQTKLFINCGPVNTNNGIKKMWSVWDGHESGRIHCGHFFTDCGMVILDGEGAEKLYQDEIVKEYYKQQTTTVDVDYYPLFVCHRCQHAYPGEYPETEPAICKKCEAVQRLPYKDN